MHRSLLLLLVACAPDRGEPTDLPASCAGDVSSVLGTRTPPTRLQAVGDSILAHNREEQASIADLVGTELGVPMRNHAEGGATVLGDDGIPTLYEPGTDSHVLVNGGGNDFAAECDTATLDAILTADLQSGAMADLVDRIADDGAQTVFVSYFLPRDRAIGCPLVLDLQRRYRAMAEARDDVQFICTLETITPDTPELYASPRDPVHPSPQGSAAVAALIARELQSQGPSVQP